MTDNDFLWLEEKEFETTTNAQAKVLVCKKLTKITYLSNYSWSQELPPYHVFSTTCK